MDLSHSTRSSIRNLAVRLKRAHMELDNLARSELTCGENMLSSMRDIKTEVEDILEVMGNVIAVEGRFLESDS